MLERAHVSDLRSDTLKAAQDVLVRHNIALNRRVMKNYSVASQLERCSRRGPVIASRLEDLQDSVD